MDYIRDNAFRVLGLPVNATDRHVAGRYDELLTYQQIGQVPVYQHDFMWLGDLDRSEDSLRLALQELQNPATKVKHVLFWFWSEDETDSLALDCLKGGRKDQALTMWFQLVGEKKHTWTTVNNISTLLQVLAADEHDVHPEIVSPRVRECLSWRAMQVQDDNAWTRVSALVPDYRPSTDFEDEQRFVLRAIHTDVNCPPLAGQ